MNIKKTTQAQMCSACGSCVVACPQNCISITRAASDFLVAKVEESSCIHCGKCLHVCPGLAENGIGTELQNAFYGEILQGYVGYAADANVRRLSQSGGIVTALLSYMVETKRITGAWVTRFNPETKRPEPYFAKSKEELIDCCGSYYAQTSVLEKISSVANDTPYAAVVLGCQAEGLHLLRKENERENLPAYTLGLICEAQYSGKMIDALATVKPTDTLTFFRFRNKIAGGWPGNIRFEKNGKIQMVSQKRRHLYKKIFEAHRCLFCFDQLNVYSDITFGDPWGIPEKETPDGYTVFLTRTPKGEALIQEAIRDGAIVAEPLESKRILKGQGIEGAYKEKFYACKKWAEENRQAYPYADSLPVSPLKEALTGKAQKEYNERLRYTKRTAELATREKASCQLKKEIRKAHMRDCLRRPVMFAKRCLRYGKRKVCQWIRKK